MSIMMFRRANQCLELAQRLRLGAGNPFQVCVRPFLHLHQPSLAVFAGTKPAEQMGRRLWKKIGATLSSMQVEPNTHP